jgi:uncharacterized membrane protein YraQ (UPF0718 family)
MNEITVVFGFIVTQFQQIAPYWIIGLVIGSILSVFCKERIGGIVEKMNQKRWGIFGIVPAALLGIVSPLCMYGTIPVAAALAQRKIREDWLTLFMVCSILLNPQLCIPLPWAFRLRLCVSLFVFLPVLLRGCWFAFVFPMDHFTGLSILRNPQTMTPIQIWRYVSLKISGGRLQLPLLILQ